MECTRHLVFPQYLFHSYRSFQFIHHERYHKHHIFDGGMLEEGVKNASGLLMFCLLLPLRTSSVFPWLFFA